MPAEKPAIKNNKKRKPITEFKSKNIEPPLAEEFRASWQLEYDRLSTEEKKRVDIAKRDEQDGCYKRDWFVDAFVNRVIANVEPPITTEKQ